MALAPCHGSVESSGLPVWQRDTASQYVTAHDVGTRAAINPLGRDAELRLRLIDDARVDVRRAESASRIGLDWSIKVGHLAIGLNCNS
jgi:hypothetical protein